MPSELRSDGQTRLPVGSRRNSEKGKRERSPSYLHFWTTGQITSVFAEKLYRKALLSCIVSPLMVKHYVIYTAAGLMACQLVCPTAWTLEFSPLLPSCWVFPSPNCAPTFLYWRDDSTRWIWSYHSPAEFSLIVLHCLWGRAQALQPGWPGQGALVPTLCASLAISWPPLVPQTVVSAGTLFFPECWTFTLFKTQLRQHLLEKPSLATWSKLVFPPLQDPGPVSRPGLDSEIAESKD